MKQTIRKIKMPALIVALLLACVQTVAAAQMSFSVNAPRQVVEGNQFQITYVLQNAEGSGIKVAEVGGATLLYGPTTSTSSSMQWINGKQSSSYTCQYTYTYRAQKAGKYTVDAATVIVDGKAVKSKPFSLEILPPDASSQSSNGANSQSQSTQIGNTATQSAGKEVTDKDIFVRINLSKHSVYEQEALICSIKLYTKYEISSFMGTVQPSFNGFLIEDLPVKAQLNDIEHYNGQNYMVAELRRYILYPQESGKLTITSGSYDVSVIQYQETRSFFGIMRTPVEKQIKMQSNQATLNVTPLPSPRPDSFTGAVGKYKISSNLNTSKFKTNEAATFDVVVSGTGNIKFIKSPKVELPSQFEVYEPQNTSNVSVAGSDMTGSQKWEYTFIPEYVGDFTIDPIGFTYFNLDTKKYETLHTEAHKITVEKGAGTTSSAASGSAVNKSDIVEKNKDILHIKTGNLSLSRNHSYIVASWTYWLWYIIPLAALIILTIAYRKVIKDRSNVQLMRTKKAGKIAKKRLKTAKAYMDSRDNNAFYAETLKALWGYLSDKLHIPVSELTKENITSELEKYGASAELTTEIIRILDECEFAQYAPQQTEAQMETIYKATSEVMDKIENTRKK